MFRLNKNPERLVVGQKVKTDYIEGEENVVRKIVAIVEHEFCQSGFLIKMEGVKKTGSRLYRKIDASWALELGDEGYPINYEDQYIKRGY